MKIICNQKKLSNKISIVQKAINNKTTLELLKGISLKAKDNKLILTGYDLEIGIESFIDVEIIEEGEIVVNAKLFGDIVRKLPQEFINIETDNTNNISISSGNSNFKIKGESTKDYPQLPEIDDKYSIEIEQDTFRQMIRETVFATSQDQTKPILMGELLEISSDEASLVAIDGYRLAAKTIKLSDNNINNVEVVIPAKSLIDIASLLNEEDKKVQLSFDDKNIIVNTKETRIISRLLDGNFINYSALLPKEYNTKIKANTRELLNSIERASLLSQANKNNLIKMIIRDNILIITSNSENGEVYEEVSIQLEGDYLDIAFNSRYMMDGLKAIESKNIFLEFTSNINPCILKPENDDKYIYLLLPVRISVV